MKFKELKKLLGVDTTQVEEYAGVKYKNINYLYNNSKNKYDELVYSIICKHYKISALELIKILDLYNIQRDKK